MKNDEVFYAVVMGMEDAETKMAYINLKGYKFTSDELEKALRFIIIESHQAS